MRQIKHRNKKQVKQAYETRPDSGSKDDIIEWIVKTDFVDNYIQKLMFKTDYSDIEDITQDIWIIILDIKQDKWDELYKQGSLHIIQYLSGLIYRQICSTTSDTYKKYKAYKEHFLNMTDTTWTIFEKTNTFKNERPTQEDKQY